MIREFFLETAELLFRLLDGQMVGASPWILAYLITVVLILSWPLLFLNYLGAYTKLACGFGIITFFPLMFLALGPIMTQQHLMRECNTVRVIVASERSAEATVDLRECRRKVNFFEEFGPWQFSNALPE